MNYQELAQTIIEKIGGQQNVSGLTHCATRLRFNLKNEDKALTDDIKNTAGVMGVVSKGGQYQVIIGSDVGSVYKEIVKEIPALDGEQSSSNEKDERGVGSRIIDTITGIFTPILPAITAAGMLKAVLSLLVVFNAIDKLSQTYIIIDFMADAAFYFLPILLAASSAQKFKTNMYLAMMVGGILLHPNFTGMVAAIKEAGEGGIHLFGMPISPVTYGSSVIPIILSVWFMSYVEPIADKVSPKVIKFFSKPLITIAIVGTVSLVVIGPFGYLISDAISNGIKALENFSPWLVPTLIGGLTPLFVATGTHYGLVPIGINNRITNGYDTVIYPGMLASNVGQGAAAMAVGFKSKNSSIKQMASSAGLTGLFGITEPALYGVNLKYKTPLYAAMIGGGLGGLFMGLTKVKNFTGGSPGLITLPSYIGDDTLQHLYFACIGAAISIVISFALSYMLYKDPVTEEEQATTKDEATTPTTSAISGEIVEVTAPIKGEIVALSAVEDGMFSEEILGKGFAVKPVEGKVYAPVAGTITAVFDSKHAIGLTSESGVELLIHIGIDTVQLNGEGYEYLVGKGQKVQAGDLLIQFDLEKIAEKGYPTITPVVVTNSADFGDIITLTKTLAEPGEQVMKVIR
ncbi:beta-glucoside-specific PTS transporter subunit IIABC [Isobaculum melis]|uniref:PTS system sucrose-specific EIIBCA component n=1 Tax=Isobaculum melis TaxID=142588 RepID=A0A1H9QU18_9LACT|nr:beta-glucoside-specific PTS transporter subunit IIABC [Isobaculum melis]SER63359.1 PTS system beta-glucoside-specific IIA component, Glc family /PTS system beta-glucoside-specific IIB component, Glc family /PTS system beta-glucoside-specific IIC component, Glc family [Isobaculum melis]